ncbi:MAG: sugar phosphate isomerase/epimerase family protein [Janthinobacterium lividum]
MNLLVSRRAFVFSSMAAGAGATLPAWAGSANIPEASPQANLPVKLGLASYTFRNFTRSQMIDFMKQLRLTELNCKDVKDHLPADPVRQAAALRDYAENGIKVHAIGAVSFANDNDADIHSKFEYAKRAGVRVIVAGDPTLASLARIGRFAAEYDIRIAIHNHGPEDKLWHSPLDVFKAVANMDPRLGCCIDIGHCVRAGTDVVEAIHTVGPRLFNVHAKDLSDLKIKESQVAVGDGSMPIRKIFQALIATRYEGFVDLEYEINAQDPMPGVISSFAFMRGVLAGMGYPA